MDQQRQPEESALKSRLAHEKLLYPERAAAARDVDAEADRSPPRLVMCVGIPGSGKSTFSALLVAAGWVSVNQDTLGTRQKCEAAARKALIQGHDVVVDRCNTTREQRAHWIKIATVRGCAIGCVVFRPPVEVCVQRALARTDHPSLKAGMSGPGIPTIVRAHAANFVYPVENEGIRKLALTNDGWCVMTTLDPKSCISNMFRSVSLRFALAIHTTDFCRIIDDQNNSMERIAGYLIDPPRH
jgi:AAA domain